MESYHRRIEPTCT